MHRGPAGDQLARVGEVLGPLDEGEGHPVEAELEAEVEVGPVLVGQGRDRQDGIGDIDPLAVGQGPPASTVVSAKSAPQRSTLRRILPSSSSSS